MKNHYLSELKFRVIKERVLCSLPAAKSFWMCWATLESSEVWSHFSYITFGPSFRWPSSSISWWFWFTIYATKWWLVPCASCVSFFSACSWHSFYICSFVATTSAISSFGLPAMSARVEPFSIPIKSKWLRIICKHATIEHALLSLSVYSMKNFDNCSPSFKGFCSGSS